MGGKPMVSSNVTVTINGKDYPMACAPGEEKKIEALGARINEVASQVAAASGSISESRLLVMAALILTDQMKDLEDRIASSLAPVIADEGDEEKTAELIEQLALRLEKLASAAP